MAPRRDRQDLPLQGRMGGRFWKSPSTIHAWKTQGTGLAMLSASRCGENAAPTRQRDADAHAWRGAIRGLEKPTYFRSAGRHGILASWKREPMLLAGR